MTKKAKKKQILKNKNKKIINYKKSLKNINGKPSNRYNIYVMIYRTHSHGAVTVDLDSVLEYIRNRRTWSAFPELAK
jgi:hypothetical protein